MVRTVQTRLWPVAHVFAGNQVNAVVFRGALMSWGERQYAGFYDPAGQVVIGARRRGEADWELRALPHRGAMRDAHNAISIGVSHDGRLHVAYDHHGGPLRYRRGAEPGLGPLGPEEPMTGRREGRVTYPQFVNSPDGRFYFFYRDGASGNGDLCLNLYEPAEGRWWAVQHPLITGEGRASPYWWQPAVGADGALHLAWCWRRTGDAGTNHDVCYAVSRDGGQTWRRTDGSAYRLPITADQAEVADPVPEGANLMNTGGAAVDAAGRPHLAHYRDDACGVPQMFHVHFDGRRWRAATVTRRTQRFRLSGGGTLRPPLSRPAVVADCAGTVHIVYRDDEAGGRVRLSSAAGPDYAEWRHHDLTAFPVGAWEPSLDPVAWRLHGQLELWVHACEQGDHERNTEMPPQPAYVLEVSWAR